MSWIQKLYETYENCQSAVGIKNEDNKTPLVPVAHILQQAQIEISIDQNGIFIGADLITKNDAGTIIPCTEESGSRSGSDPKSHPLCDKLQYVAKDFSEHLEGATPEYKERQAELHKDYQDLLTKWCESKFSHPKAQAVLKYIQKGTVTKDLIDSSILKCEANGKLKQKYASLVVRWKVYIPNYLQDKVWCDKELFDSWINFEATIKKGNGICYVTGNKTRLAKYHSKFIRVPGDSAKLISSNDTSGFTFLGRFLTAEQACAVSFEVTQKAHNALRWLIGRQGKVFFEGKRKEPGLTIVAWATSDKLIPDPLADPYTILGFDKIQSDSDFKVSTAQELATRLNKKISGYSIELGDTTDIIVMGMDSATPGRLSITFYRELSSSDFLNRLGNWHNTCCWIHDYHKKEVIDSTTGNKREMFIRFVGAPAPGDIAQAAYGSKVDDKLRKTTVERILPCIIDGGKLPRDLIESAVRRASNRVSMKEWEWNKTLSIACALYKKYQKDYKKEDIDMALDRNRKTRDYLYGRLLALADNIEQRALKEIGENRQTTAARLMQRFADHPNTTWRTIELALGPYKGKLGNYRQKEMDEVMDKFDSVNEFTCDKPLSGEFLLGYHCQRAELWKKKEENNNETEEHSDVK